MYPEVLASSSGGWRGWEACGPGKVLGQVTDFASEGYRKDQGF